MRTSSIYAAILAIALIFNSAQIQAQETKTREYSFVIIGAFTFIRNAEAYTKWANQKNLTTFFAMNPNRNLYYVYTFKSLIKSDAVSEVYKVRSLVEDAWVYTGPLNGIEGERITPSTAELDAFEKSSDQAEKSENETVATSGDQSTEKVINESGNSNTDLSVDNTVNVAENDSEINNNDLDTSEAPVFMEEDSSTTDLPPVELVEPNIKEQYKMYVNAVNTRKLTEVKNGELDIIDLVRNRKMKDALTHELFGINDPKNGNSSIEVASRIFGFRPISISFLLSNPASDTTGNVYTIGDSIVVDLPLVPLQHGDLGVMWNVLFYKDAAIMRPESRGELSSLLEMLNENDDYKIVLHGHTNGSSTGKIIHLNDSDREYFSMNGDHSESKGSAKKLSEERAYTIQQWLIEQGIPEDRIEIRGWGGKRMLYDQDDANAFMNVRVEVEVL